MKPIIVSILLAVALNACTGSDIANIARQVSFTEQTSIKSDPSSPLKTAVINIKQFDEIEVSQGLTVDYIQGPATQVMLTAPEDIFDYISITTDDDSTLKCQIKGHSCIENGSDKVKIAIIAPNVKSFEASSGATIYIGDRYSLPNEKIELEASSAAKIRATSITGMTISCDASSAATIEANNLNMTQKVEADATSAATINLSGSAQTADFEASSGAKINAIDLSAQNGSCESESGATIKCDIVNPNKIQQSSGGSIHNSRK